MVKQTIISPDAIPCLPVFAHACISDGKVYVSGSIGCDRNHKVVPGGVKAQTLVALDNIHTILRASNSDLEHVVKMNVYMAHLQRDFADMNEAYLQVFPQYPHARTCVGVACLPLGADVEFECIAEVVPAQAESN
ncbi:YjgF-like protein [Cristinia sonorae]|uniref:YjgF-like protein n=1 Tax=Cristinia sonorae TaxID=1940300 RepID=A0A8K0UU04_9AGAR|nr:YjgF-like protein [Cristinia sonorae]